MPVLIPVIICSGYVVSIKCYTQEHAMNAILLLILQVDKLYLINLWISNVWKYFVHHQSLVSAWNLALFCNYKATLSWQNLICGVFGGLKRSWFIVDLIWVASWVAFTSAWPCHSENCPVQLQICVTGILFLTLLVVLEVYKSPLRVGKRFPILC